MKKSIKKIKKNFFKKSENFEEEKKFRRKIKIKNAIILVLPIEEISLQPELSRPLRFRIQGGGTVSFTKDGRTDE